MCGNGALYMEDEKRKEKCNNCDCAMYCTGNSCIEDEEENEEFYRNQDIVEGL